MDLSTQTLMANKLLGGLMFLKRNKSNSTSAHTMKEEDAMEYEQALACLETINAIKSREEITWEQLQVLVDSLEPIVSRVIVRAEKGRPYADGFEPRVEIARVISALTGAMSMYAQAGEELRRMGEETQDILHAMEFGDISESELIQLANDLRTLRKERRRVKDFFTLARPLYTLAENNAEFIEDLKQARRDTEGIEKKQKNRIYRPRHLTSLEQAFREAEKKEE